MADQEAGVGAFYLLVDDDASVLARFNLDFGSPGTAVLGQRIAQQNGQTSAASGAPGTSGT